MVLLAIVPLVVLTVGALVTVGVVRSKFAEGWSRDTRHTVLAGLIGIGVVLYLHRGEHCAAVSPDGRYRASVCYNSLLLHAGVSDPEVVIEGRGRKGLFVAVRHRLEGDLGVPARLAWHPDGRRVACVQCGDRKRPHCTVVRVMPRLASAWREQREVAGP